jgi:hypothetical protein
MWSGSICTLSNSDQPLVGFLGILVKDRETVKKEKDTVCGRVPHRSDRLNRAHRGNRLEFPPPIYLVMCPDLGRMFQGTLVTIDNCEQSKDHRRCT